MARDAAKGCQVYTNIRLFRPAFDDLVFRKYKWRIPNGQVVELSDAEMRSPHRFTRPGTKDKPAKWYLDEDHFYRGARNFQKNDAEDIDFISQMRHEHTECYWISQHGDKLDKEIRRQADWIYSLRDMQTWVLPVVKIGDPFPHTKICKYDYDGRTLVDTDYFLRTKEWFKVYDSFQTVRKFDRAGDSVSYEGSIKTEATWRDTPGFHQWCRIGVMALILITGVTGCKAKRLWDADKRVEKLEKRLVALEKNRGGTVPAAVAPVASMAVPAVVEDNVLHVRGAWVRADGKWGIKLSSGQVLEEGSRFKGKVVRGITETEAVIGREIWEIRHDESTVEFDGSGSGGGGSGGPGTVSRQADNRAGRLDPSSLGM